VNRQLLDFLLFDWLQAESLCALPRYADHNREVFGAVLDTCERLAREKFAPVNRLVDIEEPHFDGERVHLPAATAEATRAFLEAGLLAAGQDADIGGMQLPYLVELAANAYFYEASVALSAYAMLSGANANLVMANGSAAQKVAFAQPIWDGRAMGTMCLSEPQAGSGLADLRTRAEQDGAGFEQDPLGPRYRLRGNKMWISGGDHELSENIVHLVLAKIPDEQGRLPAGVKGISLFIVPRLLVEADGTPTGERNDVSIAGLNHKLGYRGTVNTLLNFGEGRYPVRGSGGAIGYRVGAAGDGLRQMFHMMNEARINVGLGAAMLGMAGYAASLDYARTRTQGRPLRDHGDGGDRPVPIVQHPDVRRMLLAQKAYAEGALALCLYAARLVDDKRSANEHEVHDLHLLIELLTPVVKSWPSQWCLEANDLAIQVHGGYGYTRDFPVEQFWRDNRLNLIHEGTHGIQALDLLRRKVRADGGRALDIWAARVEATCRQAAAEDALSGHAAALATAVQQIRSAVQSAWQSEAPDEALANATSFLQAFGHVVVAWLLLDLARVAGQLLTVADGREDLHRGTRHACVYFFRLELPRVAAWLAPVAGRDSTYLELKEEWL
jgi:alkylation response protein AidB-like acyl-CoA dehydrogenase